MLVIILLAIFDVARFKSSAPSKVEFLDISYHSRQLSIEIIESLSRSSVCQNGFLLDLCVAV